MGMMHATYALLRRPRRLIISEAQAERRAAAARLKKLSEPESTALEVVEPARLGDAVRAASGGRGADDLVVTAGFARVEEEAVALAAPGGCVSFFASNAPGEEEVTLKAGDIHYRSV